MGKMKNSFYSTVGTYLNETFAKSHAEKSLIKGASQTAQLESALIINHLIIVYILML
jgi:hypothetical protein